MTDVQSRRRRSRARRAFTLMELVITLAIVTLLVALAMPIAHHARSGGLRTVSLKNLVVLGEAQACYASDWEGRQWSMAPRDIGAYNGNCSTYVTVVTCPPQALLGWGSNGGMWGFFLGNSGLCSELPPQASCGAFVWYRPLTLGGFGSGSGAFRVPSFRGMQEYVGLKYYEKEWFSELDSLTWGIADNYFPLPDQFTSQGGEIAFPAYCLSPAAMYHPGVFRRPSQGGYQDPNANFPDSYRAPSLDQCLHPDLKTRMVEHSWLVNPPSPSNPNFNGTEPWYFNHGITSRPGALFFDGSVQEMTMKQAVADDEAMRRSTGFVDGLWSRDTPFGTEGYYGGQAFDDTRNSFHILTTDGILGRDFLKRLPGRPIQ